MQPRPFLLFLCRVSAFTGCAAASPPCLKRGGCSSAHTGAGGCAFSCQVQPRGRTRALRLARIPFLPRREQSPNRSASRLVILSGGEAGVEGSRPLRKVCLSGCCKPSNSAPSGSFADAQDDKGGSLVLDDVLRLLRRGDPCGRPPLASPRVGERCREATERGRPSTSQSRPSSPARPKFPPCGP